MSVLLFIFSCLRQNVLKIVDMTDGKSHISSPCETHLSSLQPTLLIIMRLEVRGKGSSFTGAGESEYVIVFIQKRNKSQHVILKQSDARVMCYILYIICI